MAEAVIDDMKHPFSFIQIHYLSPILIMEGKSSAQLVDFLRLLYLAIENVRMFDGSAFESFLPPSYSKFATECP